MTGLAADAALVLQAGLVLAVLEGLRRRNVPAVVNGLVALGAALLPVGLRAVSDVPIGPELPLWIAVAGLVHAVGMLGFYDSVWWWDHLAHAISAALVTALSYAAVLSISANAPFGPLGPSGVVLATLGLVLAVGVLWELIEELARHVAERYEMGPLLVIYGPFDWLFDLAFNLVGAGLVLLMDLRLFVPMFEPYPGGTRWLLLGVGGVAVVSDGLLALYLFLAADDWP